MNFLNSLVGLGTAILAIQYASGQLVDNQQMKFAVIGRPFSLSCISDNKRPIQSCELEIQALQNSSSSRNKLSSQLSLQNIQKPALADLKNGICNFTILDIEPKHIGIWFCKIIFVLSDEPDRSDLKFHRKTTVAEAKKPNPPEISSKTAMQTLLANSWTMVSSNNNTVNLECCSENGTPLPKLEFFLDGVLKVQKQLVDGDACVSWPEANFQLYDNGKTVSCRSTHITTPGVVEGVNEDSFLLNVLHAPTIIDQNMLDSSITTYIDSITEVTEIIVRFSSNPSALWQWSEFIRDLWTDKYIPENISTDDEYKAMLLPTDEKDVYEAVLRIRNTKSRNWRRRYLLKLKNPYGQAWIDFNVTQIVLQRSTANLELENTSTLIVSDDDTNPGGNNTVNVTCCIRTGKPSSEVNLLLDEDVYAAGKIQNDTENPFCHTWIGLEFNTSAHKMMLKCHSDDVNDWIIYIGDENANQKETGGIMIHVLEPLTPFNEGSTEVPLSTTLIQTVSTTKRPTPQPLTPSNEDSTEMPLSTALLVPTTVSTTRKPIQQAGPKIRGPYLNQVVKLVPWANTTISVVFSWMPYGNMTWMVKYEDSNEYTPISSDDQFSITIIPNEPDHTHTDVWNTMVTIKPRLNGTTSHRKITALKLKLQNDLGRAEFVTRVEYSTSKESEIATTVLADLNWTLGTEIHTPPTKPAILIPQTASSTEAEMLTQETSTTEPEMLAQETSSTEAEMLAQTPSSTEPEMLAQETSTTEPSTVFNTSIIPTVVYASMSSTTSFDMLGSTKSEVLGITTAAVFSTTTEYRTLTTTIEEPAILSEASEIPRPIPQGEYAPIIASNSTTFSVNSSSLGMERRIRIKFIANPVGNVTWSFRDGNSDYRYINVEYEDEFESRTSQLPGRAWEATLVVKPRRATTAGKIHQRRLFILSVENSHGKAKVHVHLPDPDDLKSSHAPLPSITQEQARGELKRYQDLGIAMGIFLVVGLTVLLLYVSKANSILCFKNRRGSFLLERNRCTKY